MGVELGQALARLGVKVTLIQGPERVLPREDPDISEAIAGALRSSSVRVETNACVLSAVQRGEKKSVTVKQGERMVTFEADEILPRGGSSAKCR